MLKKIKNTIFVLGAFLLLASAVPVSVSAQGGGGDDSRAVRVDDGLCKGAEDLQLPPDGVPDADRCETLDEDGEDSTTGLNRLLSTIINVFSVIVGIIAVIMIIWGGLRYITSGGDATKVGNAKNTILYALIGLIIVALAQVVVKFVLNKTIGAGDGS